MARRHERNPLADEDRDDVDVKLIDLASIQERRNQLTAPHHPDVLTRRLAQALRKRLDRLRHELYAGLQAPSPLPRRNVVGDVRVERSFGLAPLLVIIEQPIVGLASLQDRVDRPVKLAHPVIDRIRPAIEPFDVPIRPGNVAIGARRDVSDDSPSCLHGPLTRMVPRSRRRVARQELPRNRYQLRSSRLNSIFGNGSLGCDCCQSSQYFFAHGPRSNESTRSPGSCLAKR